MLLERRRLLLGFVPVALIAGACQADERGSEVADREAAVLALVVALDQTMLLSDAQREELLPLLLNRWKGVWRTPGTWRGLVKQPGAPWQSAMTRSVFAVLDLPESEWSALLRPAQLAVCHELRVYGHTRSHRMRELPTEPRKPELLFDLSLDDVAVACRLSDDQQAKLRFAGKLDLNHAEEWADWATRHRRANDKALTAPALTNPSFPAGALPADLPRYRKALSQWLTAEQRQALHEAHQRRREFERRAELAAIKRIIRCYAKPTDLQCERLSEWIEHHLGETALREAKVGVRAQLLETLSLLPSDEVADMLAADRGNFRMLWKELRTEVQKGRSADRVTFTQ